MKGIIMSIITKNIKVIEVAAMIGKPKECIYGMIQAGVVDFGVYYKKEGSNRGTYIVLPGRLAEFMCITLQELIHVLEEIRGEAA